MTNELPNEHSSSNRALSPSNGAYKQLSLAAMVLASASMTFSANAFGEGKKQSRVNVPSIASQDKSPVQILSSVDNSKDVGRWMVINDGVMGGKSTSTIEASAKGAIFSGTVSPENGGGFASARTAITSTPSQERRAIAVRVLGDGKRYQFRVRTDNRWDGPAYKYTFATKTGTWQEIVMPLSEFQASFRGRILSNTKPLASQEIQQVGFLIADEQYGSFKLEFAEIKLL